MTTVDVIREHIQIVEGPSGPKARIAGHQIRVQDIVLMHQEFGLSPQEIVKQLTTITLADVYAALAYYWDHRDEIDTAIADEHAYAEEMRRQQGPGLLEQKLGRRWRE